MTKKDYQAIAIARVIHGTTERMRRLNPHRTEVETVAFAADWIRQLTEDVADAMAADNPRFDRARFVEACETGTTRGMHKEGAR